MKKTKVAIIYNQLFHYREPIFKNLAEAVELTVVYSIGSISTKDHNFTVLRWPIFRLGRFVIHANSLFRYVQNFDVVIAYGDIAWLKLSTLPFYRNRQFKFIFWSPGVSASYEKKFDEVTKWDNVRDFFYSKADALIFYSDYPITKYESRGYNRKKLFVAPNTVEVYSGYVRENVEKNCILFIGSLYKQKGILNLLEAYKNAYTLDSNLIELIILGEGRDFEYIRKWIDDNNLNEKVSLKGGVYNVKEKAYYFSRAYLCISPMQAGLSVLESMGYGVPFVTSSDAITGGERLNIINGVNSFFVDNICDLTNLILDVKTRPEWYLQIGENARNYYSEYRAPEKMVKGILDAIEFVL